jgi:hypothetical protein
VRYHTPGPNGADPWYLANTGENSTRLSYYGPAYVPYLFVDGSIDAGYDYPTWESHINSEMSVASPLDIQIDGEFEPMTRSGHVNLRIIATQTISYSSLKVRIALIESNITRTAPNGTQIHNQTFRDLTPNATGLNLTIQQGDTASFTQAFTCGTAWVLANCDIVVFVQSDSGHRILQGAKRNLMTMTYYLDPFALISPTNGDSITTCYPHCVWHKSNDPDSGFAISYQVVISYSSSFSDTILSPWLTDTTWVSPFCLWSDTTVYWKAVASNGHAQNRESNQVFTFRVVEPPACQYIAGDINNNGTFNGIDVSYGVGYFKGGPPPPYSCDCIGSSWYVAGDVNGNCVFNGIDISYAVSYFKGGAMAVSCPSCPSAR